jgi:hypothetical protein
VCFSGNIFLWDKLLATQKEPAPILGEFVRAQPPVAASKKLTRAFAATGRKDNAGTVRTQAAASAAHILSIQRVVAAVASAIMGTEVCSPPFLAIHHPHERCIFR